MYQTSREDPARPNHPDTYPFIGWAVASGPDECPEPIWASFGRRVNAPPVIIKPDNQSYLRGQAIDPLAIVVQDDEGSPVVTVEGLPDGLAYDPEEGMTGGRVTDLAAIGAYVVTITASDGQYVVVETFTITVYPPLSYAAPNGMTGPVSGEGESTAATYISAQRPSSNSLMSLSPLAPGLTGAMGFEDLPLVPLSLIALMLLLFLLLAGLRRRRDRPRRTALT